MLYFRFKGSFHVASQNLAILALIHVVDLFIYFWLFFSTAIFLFILCLWLYSSCLWSAPLSPARRIHDKAWRPAIDTGPSDTGRLLNALASFSLYTGINIFTFLIITFSIWYDNIQMYLYSKTIMGLECYSFYTAQFVS